MKVYHVSREDDPEFLFEPRVPANRLANENDTDKRICVAPSIDKAILGMWGVAVKDGWPIDIPKVTEYSVTDQGRPTSCTFKRVYCADAEPVKPRDVPDAKFTGELWLEEPTLMVLEGQIGTFRDNDVNNWFWDRYGSDEYHRWKRTLLRNRPKQKRIDCDAYKLVGLKKNIEHEYKLSSFAPMHLSSASFLSTGYGISPNYGIFGEPF